MEDWFDWRKTAAQAKKTLETKKLENFKTYANTFNRFTNLSVLWKKNKFFKNQANATSPSNLITTFDHEHISNLENLSIEELSSYAIHEPLIEPTNESIVLDLDHPFSPNEYLSVLTSLKTN